MDYPDPAETPLGQHYEMTTHLIALELIRRGHTDLHWLRPAMFVANINGLVLGWNMSRCVLTSTVGAETVGRKDYTRQLLRLAGLPVADGGSYRPDQHDQALAKAQRVGWPVMVKPVGGGKGKGVGVAGNPAEFATAWEAASGGPKVVVERRVAGDEARFLVVQGRCVAVAGRIPPAVVGDGTSTLAELVAAKQAARAVNPHLADKPVPPPGDPRRVPDIGQRVVLDHRGGFSTGADSVDLTDTVHPSYLTAAEQAEQAFPGLGLAGVDIIATDYSQPATADNYVVLEVNSRPAIGAHHFPAEGEPRDVAAAIVDACGVP